MLQELTRLVNGIEIFSRESIITDSGDLCLFLHGLGCSSEVYHDLERTGFFARTSVLLPDFVGFGHSGKPADFSYRMEDQAELLREFLSAFHFTKLHIIAHSMGGAIGLLLTNTMNEKLSSFLNAEGNLIAEDCGILSRGIASLTLDDYKSTLFPEQVKEFSGHAQLQIEASTPEAMYMSAASLVSWSDSGELLELFKALPVKKCYFFGETNKGMPVLPRIDFADKIMIAQSGHGMMTDNPAEFYAKAANFINLR